MKTFLMVATCTGILLCGTVFAQSTNTADPNTPPAQPTTSAPQPQQQMAPQATQPVPAAQAPTNEPPAANGTPKIAPGSVIPVQLTKTVDAKKAKTGDQVEAKVTQDMKTSSGEVLVPKDTKILGHVTEAQARSKEQKESQLAIAFDRAVMKNGTDVQLPMSVQAIIGQQNNNQAAPSGNDAGAAPSGGTSPSPAGGAGRSGMAGSTPPPTPSATATETAPSDSQTASKGNPPINGQTQGVIGIPNVKFSAANGSQASVVTSEKNNVKLESGTMLLLKVSQ